MYFVTEFERQFASMTDNNSEFGALVLKDSHFKKKIVVVQVILDNGFLKM